MASKNDGKEEKGIEMQIHNDSKNVLKKIIFKSILFRRYAFPRKNKFNRSQKSEPFLLD